MKIAWLSWVKRTVRAGVRCLAVGVFSLSVLVFCARGSAAETDQFTMPTDGRFADLGGDVTRWYYEALVEGMNRANDKIAASIDARKPKDVVAEFQSTEELVNAVDHTLLGGNDIVEALEAELASPELQRRHPGERIYFRETRHNIYQHAFFILDWRILSRFFFGSTIKIFGHYVGTDKFGHFSSIGVSYYWRYSDARKAGASDAEALRTAVRFGTTGIHSEDGLMGLTSTGDYANGDLAANYAGFLFFRNLTESVEIAGTRRPPLLVRRGAYWQLSPHVQIGSDFFRPFVTDHWNEALNPGYFMESMRPALRAAVRERTSSILATYCPMLLLDDASLQTYFRRRRLDLQTYYGTDYGHRGDDQSLVTIENCCFGN